MEEKEEEYAWEPIQFQPHQAQSIEQEEQVQFQAQSREWQMVEQQQQQQQQQSLDDDDDDDDDDDEDNDNDNDDFSIFPPSHHEGLHNIHPNDDVEGDGPPQPQQLDVVVDDGDVPRREPLNYRIQIAKDMVRKHLRLGFEIISSKIFPIATLAHSRGANWPFVSRAGVTVALAVSFWFLKRQRWRQRSREEKIDSLILLVRDQDEKISQLLDQISCLNQLLSSRRRIPIL